MTLIFLLLQLVHAIDARERLLLGLRVIRSENVAMSFTRGSDGRLRRKQSRKKYRVILSR